MLKLYKICVPAIVLLSTAGCKKYLDVNVDPSVPQVPHAETLLPPIIAQMANGTSQDYRMVSKITQGIAGISSATASLVWETHGYPDASDAGGVIWRMTYADLGLNLEDMIKDGIDNQKYEYTALGYAIKAWAYQMCTDLHGPIILDEAFTPGQLTFHYQDQQDVYTRVREWIQLSLKYMDMKSPIDYSAKLASVTGDNIYGGNKEKWKKFLYGLLAQQYSHLINKPEFRTQYADSVVKYVDLSFANESEDATIYYSATSSGDSNPLGQQLGYLNSTYYRASVTILNYLTGGVRGEPTPDPKTSIDPRLSRMLVASADEATKDVYLAATPTFGTENPAAPLLLGNVVTGANALPGKYIFTDKARYPLMTYAQLQFAKAEALFIQGKTADAYTAYINGIKGHMEFVNLYGRASTTPDPAITQTEIDAYLQSDEVAQNSEDLTIADIMGQKYITQWVWGALEQWCDIRKYHYSPEVFRSFYQIDPGRLFSGNNKSYAYRFRPRYNSEYVWNAEELDKWGGLDRDYMTKELWFSMP